MTFRQWPSGLPPAIEQWTVQLPGRAARLSEPPFDKLEPLVDAARFGLLPYFDRPFAFFGHSMGALVAFELAHALRRDGIGGLVHLLVAGRRAPHLADTDEPFYSLPDDEFRKELRQLKGTPPDVLDHPEIMELMMPVLRADFAACETYVYRRRPPLQVPISAYAGVHDEHVSVPLMEAWHEHTAAGFALRRFPGDHFFLHSAAGPLLQAISLDLGYQF
jgi:medium-chain acyl-[acyl-carrier-protein] hydrolase